MSFDRSKFSAPKLELNKKVTEEVNKTMRVESSTRGDYLTIDEGVNIFRLFPPHNPDEPTFQAKVVYWLECRVPRTDSDNNPIEGEFEWKKRPIFDSRIHGGTPKDIIDEYIKFTKDYIFSNNDTESAKKMVAAINGWRDKSGRWNSGILPSTSFVAYATKGDITIPNLGRLELFQSDKNELEKLNVDEASGEIISTDIWSGPDDGIQFVLTRFKNDKGKWEHSIQKKSFTPVGKDINKAWKEFQDSQRIPDDVLEHWSKMEPLSSQFKNTYKRSDYERAVEALMKFDDDHGFHTFDNSEFLEVVKEIDSYYPEEEAEEKSDSFEQPEVASVDYSSMSREELKALIKSNNLPIRVLKSTSTEDLAKKVEEAMAEINSEEEEEEESMNYNAANGIPGKTAKDSSSAGAGEEEEPLPWEGQKALETSENKEEPSTSAEKAASLRKRLGLLG